MSTTSTARNLINGEWSYTGSVHESIDPFTGEVVGAYVSAGRAEAQVAIAAARSTFDTTGWSRDPSLRSRALNELAARLVEDVLRAAAAQDGTHGRTDRFTYQLA